MASFRSTAVHSNRAARRLRATNGWAFKFGCIDSLDKFCFTKTSLDESKTGRRYELYEGSGKLRNELREATSRVQV